MTQLRCGLPTADTQRGAPSITRPRAAVLVRVQRDITALPFPPPPAACRCLPSRNDLPLRHLTVPSTVLSAGGARWEPAASRRNWTRWGDRVHCHSGRLDPARPSGGSSRNAQRAGVPLPPVRPPTRPLTGSEGAGEPDPGAEPLPGSSVAAITGLAANTSKLATLDVVASTRRDKVAALVSLRTVP